MTTYSIGQKIHSIESTGCIGSPVRLMTTNRDTFCEWLLKDAQQEERKRIVNKYLEDQMMMFWLIPNRSRGEIRGTFNTILYQQIKNHKACLQQTTPSLMQRFITALKRNINTITNACAAVMGSIRAMVRKYLK